MDVEELVKRIAEMSPEEKKRLREQLREVLRIRRERMKAEVPEEAQKLVDEYWELKNRMAEIRKELLEKFNLTPRGTPMRRGYGNYDYRNTPAYNAVVEILKEHGSLSVERFEEELKKRGYKGITGTIGVVLKNLREDGLIQRVGGEIVWQRKQST